MRGKVAYLKAEEPGIFVAVPLRGDNEDLDIRVMGQDELPAYWQFNRVVNTLKDEVMRKIRSIINLDGEAEEVMYVV